MFIPRTLAGGDIRLGRGPFARAVIVTILLAAALTAILTLSVVPGQVALDVGQVAQTEIRAPRPIHFPSQSQTDAARLASAFYAGLTLLFLWLAARRLYGRDTRTADRCGGGVSPSGAAHPGTGIRPARS